MVVWWTKHQLGQKTTRHTPKHTPQGASRLVCGECVCDVWHVHISPTCIRQLATSGTFERCHGSVVDQAPTWPKNNTPYSQTHATRCISTRVWVVCVRRVARAHLANMFTSTRPVPPVLKVFSQRGALPTNLAKKQHAILPNTRHKVHLDSCVVSVCATCGTCTSRQHAYAHSPHLARLKGVMVVWWTKHQLGQKTTCHTPTHTLQSASRLVCGECPD